VLRKINRWINSIMQKVEGGGRATGVGSQVVELKKEKKERKGKKKTKQRRDNP
jgi:hypothetical protein